MLPNCAMHVTVSSGHHVNELRKINLDNVFVKYSNRLRASVSFLYPLKISESQGLSDILRGYQNRTLGQKGLSKIN